MRVYVLRPNLNRQIPVRIVTVHENSLPLVLRVDESSDVLELHRLRLARGDVDLPLHNRQSLALHEREHKSGNVAFVGDVEDGRAVLAHITLAEIRHLRIHRDH